MLFNFSMLIICNCGVDHSCEKT